MSVHHESASPLTENWRHAETPLCLSAALPLERDGERYWRTRTGGGQ